MIAAFPRSFFGCLLAGGFAIWVPATTFAQDAKPAITSIRPQSTNLIITVAVPEGFQRVTLEGRTRFSSGAWVPIGVARTGTEVSTLTFVVPRARHSEMFRVRAESTAPLPAAFYQGTNVFYEPSPTGTGGPFIFTGTGVDANTTGPGEAGNREVVESDIWKVNGDRLFVFNEYRGLQVIDITDPDHAEVTGTLPLPGVGEQMYLIDTNHVALLARADCATGSQDSTVRIVSVSDNVPKELRSLPVPGYIQESRMVGSALYVASQTCRPVPGTDDSIWEWGTMVSAYDLSRPDMPIARGTLWYPGYGNVVTATDTLLFVAGQNPTNYWRSVIRLIDITSPDGAMAGYGFITPAGRVADKFKLNYAGNILTIISETRSGSTAQSLLTRLETFRLPDPRSADPLGIVKLGTLDLGNGEQLHATRFDGNRVYIVTFFRIDPLWIVDLSDPAKPHIAGSVDVPGWSTYIHPIGDRLLTVGVETNRVAVSLFSVENPSAPSLLSRVLLGQNYSWSEANNNEKAFTVLEDIGLVLVPYSGDTTNGWTSRVQLIDLAENSLDARGIIQHQCQPRRAAFAQERVLSLSGWELLSVDVENRDEPAVRGKLDLAWPVNRIFLIGDYLVELSGAATWWGHRNESVIRVALAQDPDRTLSRHVLRPWPITGAEVNDGRLYLAQNPAYPLFILDPGTFDDPSDAVSFITTVIDLQSLPDLTVTGQTAIELENSFLGYSSWQAVWPQPGLLVWVQTGLGYGWGFWPYQLTLDVVASPGSLYWPGPYGYGGGHLLAFDVDAPDPAFLSRFSLAATNHFGFSDPFCTGPLVYLSHCTVEAVPVPGTTNLTYRQRSWLDVIDYTDAASPTLRKPVNIPGRLLGVTASGELLYTTGYHWSDDPIQRWREWVDASAYNGVEAFLVDSIPLSANWPHPVMLLQDSLLIGRPREVTSTSTNQSSLETWTLNADRKFVRTGAVVLENSAMLLFSKDNLVAIQASDNSVWLFDGSDPAALGLLGYQRTAACLGYDLEHADGTPTRGLWVPLGIYGVAKVPITR